MDTNTINVTPDPSKQAAGMARAMRIRSETIFADGNFGAENPRVKNLGAGFSARTATAGASAGVAVDSGACYAAFQRRYGRGRCYVPAAMPALPYAGSYTVRA